MTRQIAFGPFYAPLGLVVLPAHFVSFVFRDFTSQTVN